MTNEEYLNTQNRLILFAAAVEDLDLKAFVERISLSETVVPVLDPTLYRRGMRRLEAIKELARAATRVQTAHRELKGIVLKEEG